MPDAGMAAAVHAAAIIQIYCSNDKTLCDEALACASIEMQACCFMA